MTEMYDGTIGRKGEGIGCIWDVKEIRKIATNEWLTEEERKKAVEKVITEAGEKVREEKCLERL